MRREVLLIGYGSAGKRHVRNLLDLGITPYVLTRYPDKTTAVFLNDIHLIQDKNIEYCIISSPTGRHLDDLKNCLKHLSKLKNVLIEKPLECSYSRGKRLKEVARRHKLEVSIAYNLRFIKAFNLIAKFLKEKKKKINIVEVVAGQDLREWRSNRDIRQSYSAHRELGGGVDLDLSHEIDYILWLFGYKFKQRLMYRNKISNLNINSPDIFKLVLDYGRFVVDITLDYIRKPKERHLRVICDNGENLQHNFVTGTLKRNGKVILNNDDIDKSYKKMLRAFLGTTKANLCSLKEGLNILKVLRV